MLIPDTLGIKFLLVLGLVDLLEDILEAAVVALQDGVLGAHVQGQTLEEGHLEAGVSEAADGVIGVVHAHGDTTAALEVVDLDGLGLAVGRGVDQLEFAGAGDDPVSGTVLVTKGVTTDDDGLGPARHQTGDGGDDNGLTEDGTAAIGTVSAGGLGRERGVRRGCNLQDVSDRTVGGQPH